MAGKNIYNKNDSMDINELAALNETDFSPEYIEQLQQQIIQKSEESNFTDKKLAFDENNDATLFEELPNQENSATIEEKNTEEQNPDQAAETAENKDSTETAKESTENTEVSAETQNASNNEENKAEGEEESGDKKDKKSKKSVAVQNFDDNFIKKYKAKLNKQKTDDTPEDTSLLERSKSSDGTEDDGSTPIHELSEGNIVEHDLTQEQKEFNQSLDFLDGNIKYSKYVIYIDPENVDYMESLTVKERKNLINRIIREQDDIKITKNKLRIVQAVINHVLIAIFTVAASIPILYYTLNASLEATIDNYRRSQTNFQVLYKNHGKINKQ